MPLERCFDSVVEFAYTKLTGENVEVAESEHSLIECMWYHDLSGWIYGAEKVYVVSSAKRMTLPP